MKTVEWTDALSVGIQAIDEQHKTLIQHLNDLTKSVEEHHGTSKIQEMLGFLIDYADEHFSDEEKLMSDNNYPGLPDHLIQHAKFKATLKDMEDEFCEDGPTQELAVSIDSLLANWLIKHISQVDKEYSVFLADK